MVFLGSSNIGLKVERSWSCDGNQHPYSWEQEEPKDTVVVSLLCSQTGTFIPDCTPHFALFCFDFWATSSYIKDFLLTLHSELLLVILKGPYGILKIEPE